MRIVRLFMALLVAVTTSVAVGAPLAHAAGATVSGGVVTPQYQYLPGATIEVDGVAVTQTDSSGQFITPELAPGQHQIRAVAAGYDPTPWLAIDVVDGVNQTGLFLVLQPRAGTVSGTTRDANGAPVGGAALSVDGVPSGTSAADGQFSIASVAGGTHLISATLPGYGGTFGQYVFVDGDSVTDVSVGYPGGPISGTTTSSSGRVVGNAAVYVDGVLVTTSEANGQFTTPPVVGGFHEVSATAAGYLEPASTPTFVNGRVNSVSVSVGSASGLVTGVVLDQSGLPVPGATISLDGVAIAQSAPDGTYTTTTVPGGYRTLRIAAPQFASGTATFLVDGDTYQTLYLGAPLLRISGVVRDSLGTPVADATISVFMSFSSVQVTSAADGSYSVDVPAGPVGLNVVKSGFSGGSGWFAFVTTDVVVDLNVGTPPAIISGTVTDTSGVPLSGIQYWLDDIPYPLLTTGSDGGYRLETSAGSHTITFRDLAGVFRELTTPGVNLGDGEQVVRDIVLEQRTQNLRGVIRDPGGQPLPGVSVFIAEGFTSQPVQTTDSEGRFGFLDVPAGSYVLAVQPPFGRNDLLAERIPITIVDGQIVDLAVRLRPAAFIDLTITAGSAPASAQVYLYQDLEFDRLISFAEPDASGRVSFGGLEAGTYYVEVDSTVPGYASEYYPNTTLKSKAQRLQLSAAQRLSLAVPLDRSAEITGMVYGPDGKPVLTDQVQALAVGAQPGDDPFFGTCKRPVPADPVGTYRVSCLHPSMKYRVQAVSNGVDYAGQFYPNTEDPAKATQFSLQPGQTITKIDFRLKAMVPQLQLNGISPQYFRAGTTTTGVQLFGANFPKEPGALSALVYLSFNEPGVTLTVTKVVNSSLAIGTVTVASSAASFAPSPVPHTIVLSRYAGSTAYCENCLFLGDAGATAASLSGRVTNADGDPMVASRVIATGTFGQRRVTYTGTDGRWQIGGLDAGTYTVTFEGTVKWAGQFWRRSSTLAGATPVSVATAAAVSGINATLQRRAAVQITSVTQTPTQFFQPIDAVINGQGLDPIAGEFRAYIEVNGFRQPLTVTYDSSSRLRLSGYFYSIGTFDVVVEWDGAKGLESRRFVGAITRSF